MAETNRSLNEEDLGAPLSLHCWFGVAGFGCEIKSPEEITLNLLADGISECMHHEFLFEEEADEALKKCGYIKGDSDVGECPTPERLMQALKDLLSPIEIDCTVDGEAFEVSEDIRAALEKQYLEFAVDWILSWEV